MPKINMRGKGTTGKVVNEPSNKVVSNTINTTMPKTKQEGKLIHKTNKRNVRLATKSAKVEGKAYAKNAKTKNSTIAAKASANAKTIGAASAGLAGVVTASQGSQLASNVIGYNFLGGNELLQSQLQGNQTKGGDRDNNSGGRIPS